MAITIFHLFFTASSSAAAASFLAASRVSTGFVGSCARAVAPLSKRPNSTVLASMRAYIGIRPPFLGVYMLLTTHHCPGDTPGILGKGVGLVNRRKQTNNLPGLSGGEKPGAEVLVLRPAVLRTPIASLAGWSARYFAVFPGIG